MLSGTHNLEGPPLYTKNIPFCTGVGKVFEFDKAEIAARTKSHENYTV